MTGLENRSDIYGKIDELKRNIDELESAIVAGLPSNDPLEDIILDAFRTNAGSSKTVYTKVNLIGIGQGFLFALGLESAFLGYYLMIPICLLAVAMLGYVFTVLYDQN